MTDGHGSEFAPGDTRRDVVAGPLGVTARRSLGKEVSAEVTQDVKILDSVKSDHQTEASEVSKGI